MGTKPKVSPKNDCIPVFNRFQALQCIGEITLPSSTNIHAVSEHTNAKSRPSSKMLKCQAICHEKHSLASEYDASTNSETLEHRDPLVSQITTKYYLSLRIKNKNASYKELLPICSTLKLWDVQNKHKFGFTPLGDLHLPSQVGPSNSQEDPIALHAMIKDPGQTIFLGKTDKHYLPGECRCMGLYVSGLLGQTTTLLIRFGFPLDFDRDMTLLSHQNHTSAKIYPQYIQSYLDEEVQYKAILGPFQDPPMRDLPISPMMTREKPNAPHRRVIIDLSFPFGQSVNSGITKDTYLCTPFLLKLPTIDTITDQVKALGRVACFIK